MENRNLGGSVDVDLEEKGLFKKNSSKTFHLIFVLTHTHTVLLVVDFS